jgi:hypothetical protein
MKDIKILGSPVIRRGTFIRETTFATAATATAITIEFA